MLWKNGREKRNEKQSKPRTCRRYGRNTMNFETLDDRLLMAADIGAVDPIAEAQQNEIPAIVSSNEPGTSENSVAPTAGTNSLESGETEWTTPTFRLSIAGYLFIEGIDHADLPDYLIVTEYPENNTLQINYGRYDAEGEYHYNAIFTAQMSSIDRIVFDGFAGDDYFVNDSSFTLQAKGGDGDDTIYGGSNYDSIAGGKGRDRIFGREGNDWLRGHQHNDHIDGGAGHDDISGGGGDDTLIGRSGDDDIIGGAGSDKIYGMSGEDIIFGSFRSLSHEQFADGNDWIHGGSGNDLIFGSGGDDTINGSWGHDVIKGFGGNDTIYGGYGNDWLDGGEGSDTLKGQSGHDQLFGRTGLDYLYGGSGDDLLDGGDDMTRDHLFGEQGADKFIRHKHFWNDDPDAFRDYSYASGDRIENDWLGANYGNKAPNNLSPNRRQ